MSCSDSECTTLYSSDNDSSLTRIDDDYCFAEPSLDELCSLLIDSLDAASQPKHCALYLTRCVQLIEQQKGWRNHTREHNHAFWDKITRFVCSPQSIFEIDALESRLSTCRCDFTDASTRFIHGQHEGNTRKGKGKKKKASASSPSFSTFASTIFGLLHECLMKADFIKVCKATGHKPLKFWPTTPSDLLPFDGIRVVDTLMRWITKLQQPSIYAVLGRIALNTRSHTRPYLMSQKVAKTLWNGVMIVTSPITNPKSTLPMKQKRRIVDCFEDFLESVLTFWPTELITDILRTQCTDAIQMCSNAIAISFPSSCFARSNFEDGSASNYSLLAISIYEDIRGFARCPPLKSLHEEIQKHHAREYGGSPETLHYVTLYQIYRIRTRNQECAAPGCRMKAELEPSIALRHCARCKCMPYCSQTCQASAWKHPELPHRAVCKDLEALSPYLDGLKDGQVRKIAKRCLRDGTDRDLIRRVQLHVSALQTLKGLPDV